MNILVTGSSGFIGSVLVQRLKDKGHMVIEYDIVNGQDVLKPAYEDVDAIAQLRS